MKYIVVALLSHFLATQSFALTCKDVHVGFSAGIAGVVDTMLYHTNDATTPMNSVAISATASLIIGAIKEFGDPAFDNKDFQANVIGTVAGIAVSELFNNLFFVSYTDRMVMVGIEKKW